MNRSRVIRLAGAGALLALALSGAGAPPAPATEYPDDLPPGVAVEITVRVVPPAYGDAWYWGYRPHGRGVPVVGCPLVPPTRHVRGVGDPERGPRPAAGDGLLDAAVGRAPPPLTGG